MTGKICRGQPFRFVDDGENKLSLIEIAILILLVVSLVTTAVLRAGLPTFDEFYHILAARSWVRDGTLSIGNGVYERGWFFTHAVGVCFALFGESIVAARIIPALGGLAWALVMFFWARTFCGRSIAWTALVLFIFSDVFLDLSAYIRFYSWHGFFVFSVFALLTLALSSSWGKWLRIGTAIAAGGSLLLAWNCQATTFIAILGILLWLILDKIAWAKKYRPVLQGKTGKIAVLAIIVLVGASAYLALKFNIPQNLWRMYTQGALWSTRTSVLTYHWYLKDSYPLLWSLFPAAAVVAILCRPRFGLAWAIIFSVAFVLHSFAGMRAIRFLSYAMPFFFLIGATCLAALAEGLKKVVHKVDGTALNGFPAFHRFAPAIWLAVLLATFPFALVTNSGMYNAVKILAGKEANFRDGQDWTASSPELIRIAETVDVIVVTYDLAGFYYLGDVDYVLSRTVMMETDTRKEFGMDYRTGRRVIADADSLRLIMECHPSGLIIVDRERQGDPIRGTDAATSALIAEKTVPVQGLDADTLSAYVWRNEGKRAGEERCREILPRPFPKS